MTMQIPIHCPECGCIVYLDKDYLEEVDGIYSCPHKHPFGVEIKTWTINKPYEEENKEE